MISIVKAGIQDVPLLSEMARQTFIESHAHSAPKADIDFYVREKYTPSVFEKELEAEHNYYNVIYSGGQPVGFSNIVFDSPYPGSEVMNMSKLDRIYILKAFYGQQHGRTLFDYNVRLAKENHQAGIWLYTWTENERAIRFYQQNGFEIIGRYDFPISKTHSNPNHRMYLDLEKSKKQY